MANLKASRNDDQQPLDVVVVGDPLRGTSELSGSAPAKVDYGLGRLGVTTGLLTALGDHERLEPTAPALCVQGFAHHSSGHISGTRWGAHPDHSHDAHSIFPGTLPVGLYG
jgi:hypothetical protein